jgi:hypothetical protein
MAKFKTADQIAERKAFIAGADGGDTDKAMGLEQSFSELKKLNKEELIDRLEQVDNQATLIKWRIWWAIRQKFPSDKKFGQYIAELREDPTHANCVGSQQEINRMLNAGRFCEAHRINDLRRIGISQSALYELSRPANGDISKKIFQSVKGKGYPFLEIQRRIAQERAVLTVGTSPSMMDYDQPVTQPVERRSPYTVDVVKNVAQVEHQEPEEELSPEMAEVVERHETVAIMQENIEAEVKNTDDEIVSAILKFIAWYKLSPMKMIGILQLVIKRLQSETYRTQA